ncbi:Glycosyltransferase, catalytic subunit of cellulose synthase and poly-beta-1,6-N-acetylglucosamine synthase [Bryocella elongata]|uniref:Glycosyltransferase, catalytic subunit of cellulose synthase and poly-beta-1,6-N-acetylglucosamine synthase n=1 Tax=Bryocella elongata TaxID=863522 RepID=A0A1H5SLA7_9BACT|nr:glycosyltransferase family 2 protein [Bryocella elongata]SEF50738.1 Glycosyltransferase, catalytic subunit of cellulose synthase and poly-beta-1,6-N-acetylglucosamine synthase [Bryocella elongata]
MSWHVSPLWSPWLELGGWLIGGTWCVRANSILRQLPTLPDLSAPGWDVATERELSLVVVVPACNEAETIGASLDCLLAADYPSLYVLAVDDRSTDTTGAILDDYAAKHPERIGALHITDLPDGWLGKVHAMQAAVDATRSEFVLFTDADVLFSPSVLRRAMAYAEMEDTDHLVVMPTAQVKSRGEGMILGFFQLLGFWAARPWKVADDRAHDAIGVGAFNLVRRSALEEMGGLMPQRLTVIEDVTIARRIKAAGLKSRLAFAPGLVLVHWAKGARGVIRVMTKNLFSGFGFNPFLLAGAALWIVVFFLLPLLGLAWLPTVLPALLVLLSMASMYRVIGEYSLIDALYGWAAPLGAVMFLYAMLRSLAYTWWRGGIEWRGTVYPVSELRSFNDPFHWMREGMERRHRMKNAAPSRLRRWVDRWKR